MEFTFRNYKAGDEDQIIDLFNRTFQSKIDKAWWNWRYLENPIDSIRIKLAFSGDKLISHYAVSPVELLRKNKTYLTAQSMTTMTDKNFEGRGLFTRLAKSLFSDLKKDGFDFLFGFPNRKSHEIFIEKLSWSDIGVNHSLVLKFSQYIKNSECPEFRCNVQDVNKLCNLDIHINNLEAFQLKASKDFFSWRLSEKSGNSYFIIKVVSTKNDQSSHIIFKKYDKSIDIVYLNGHEDMLLHGINYMVDLYDGSEVIGINLWCSISDQLHIKLERLGFALGEPNFYFSGLALSEDVELHEFGGWKMDMLLSDLF